MADTKNKYGLSRNIPADIKRQVRRRCGFGCVVCGKALYQYEHLDPEYNEARIHDPEKIVLLCGSCHEAVTRGWLPKNNVRDYAVNPKCKEQGFSFGPFYFGLTPPEIVLGTLTCKNVATLIECEGVPVFSINNPECFDTPFLINAFLCDSFGNEIMKIENNEWLMPSTNWDTEVIGTVITVRNKPRSIDLVLRNEVQNNRLVVEKLNMEYRGNRFFLTENQPLRFYSASGHLFIGSSMHVENNEIGVSIGSRGLSFGGKGSVSIRNMYMGPSGASSDRKIGLNELCFCGSGIKYKRCCKKYEEK